MNIACTETASFDLEGDWIDQDQCQLKFSLNEDGFGECVIDYAFTRDDLVFLRDVLSEFLDSQPGN